MARGSQRRDKHLDFVTSRHIMFGENGAVRMTTRKYPLKRKAQAKIKRPHLIKRKCVPKKVREKVWDKAFGDELKGTCICCGDGINVLNWDCAHITAHKTGGQDAEDNLLPTCRSCNRSMGTENLWDFKARCYP